MPGAMCRSHGSNSKSSSNVTRISDSGSSGSARLDLPNRGPQRYDAATSNPRIFQQGASSRPAASSPKLAALHSCSSSSSSTSADRIIQIVSNPLRQRVRDFGATSSIQRKPGTALALRVSIAFGLISACAGWVLSTGNIARVAHLVRAASGPLHIDTWTTDQVRPC